MPSLPCQVCRTTHQSTDAFREHYKAPFHHYNLQRKLLDLEPVTYDDWKVRTSLGGALAGAELTEGGEQPKRFLFICTECSRRYKSKNAFLSHSRTCPGSVRIELETRQTASQRRASAVARAPNERELDEFDCLFCETRSENMEGNMEHMKEVHEFTLPEDETLEDLEGMLRYLAAKVSILHTCLWCFRQRADLLAQEGKSTKDLKGKGVFYSIQDVRNHMSEKAHQKLYFDNDFRDEYLPYYTPASNASSDFVSIDEDGEWEDLSDDSTDLEDAVFEPDTMELVLPTKRIGHRSLRVHYKQKHRGATYSDSDVAVAHETMNANKLSLRASRKQAGRHSAATAMQLKNHYAGGSYVGQKLSTPFAPIAAHHEAFSKHEEQRKRAQLKVELVANNQARFRPDVPI